MDPNPASNLFSLKDSHRELAQSLERRRNQHARHIRLNHGNSLQSRSFIRFKGVCY